MADLRLNGSPRERYACRQRGSDALLQRLGCAAPRAIDKIGAKRLLACKGRWCGLEYFKRFCGQHQFAESPRVELTVVIDVSGPFQPPHGIAEEIEGGRDVVVNGVVTAKHAFRIDAMFARRDRCCNGKTFVQVCK